MIGLATFESCKTSSPRSSSRFRSAVSSAHRSRPRSRELRTVSHESLEHARFKFEERFVRAALARAAGHRGQTAAALGLSRQGLAKLMQRLHLDA
jgi:DNA-binding NtrC family response regulator